MIKKISKLIYKALLLLDFIFKTILRRSFLIHFSEFIQKEIKSDDMKFYISNRLTLWRVNTLYEKEPETIEWIDSFDENSIFWDIGSNIGLYSVYAAKKKKSKVYSFEPSTSNLRILSRNIYINNLSSQIFILPIALNSQKSLNFSLIKESIFQEGGAENSFSVDYDWEGKTFMPKNEYNTIGASIDFFTKNKIIPFPNYIKIDVDGIEHLILEGGIKTLKNDEIKSVLIEINDSFSEQHTACIEIMNSSGFKLYKKEHSSMFDNTKYKNQYNYIFNRILN